MWERWVLGEIIYQVAITLAIFYAIEIIQLLSVSNFRACLIY